MAKTVVEPSSEAVDVTAKTKRLIDAIKKPFQIYVKDFTALSEKREELAPKFMKAFNQWAVDTGGSFVDFVRFLDPSVPKGAREYRSARSYQAADYLRTKWNRMRAAEGQSNQPRTAQERATAPATPMVGMAKVLAAFMSLIPEDQRNKVTEALHEELHWNDRQVLRLEQLMTEITPLVVAKGKVEFPKKLTLMIPEQPANEPMSVGDVRRAA